VALDGSEIERIVPMTALLDAELKAKPDKVALVSLLNGHTRRDLDRAADHLAWQLRDLGLAPGDRPQD